MARTDLVPVAALRLLLQRGFDTTSVDDLAAAAGLSRSTFFRRFHSKEGMVFADQEERLAAASLSLKVHADEGPHALIAAALSVFDHHTAHPDLAEVRWDLLHEVPALRDRELVTTHRFERLFRDHLLTDSPLPEGLAPHAPGPVPDATRTWAVGLAASTVAVHNDHLRAWTKEPDDSVRSALKSALADVITRSLPAPAAAQPMVVVVAGSSDPAEVGAQVERALRAG
ncbi:MAG: TetR/AcrR family transcriptional regulator [Galactobacter sp.]